MVVLIQRVYETNKDNFWYRCVNFFLGGGEGGLWWSQFVFCVSLVILRCFCCCCCCCSCWSCLSLSLFSRTSRFSPGFIANVKQVAPITTVGKAEEACIVIIIKREHP